MLATELRQKVFQNPLYFIAFGFGSGLMPVAPGTFGTIAALPLYLLMTSLSPVSYLGLTLAFFILGIFVSQKVTDDLGEEDYKGIVWDEVVGYLITMFLAPYGFLWMLLGFLLFRFFDIVKPSPISLIDKHIKGGLGIMLDDVLAAVFAAIVLQTIAWVLL